LIPDEHVAAAHPDRGGHFVQFDPIGFLQYEDVVSAFEDASQLIYFPIQQQHALAADHSYLPLTRIEHEGVQIFPGADLFEYIRVGIAMKRYGWFVGLKYAAETDVALQVGLELRVAVGKGVEGDASDFWKVEGIVLV
jgi:hypothetical protein